MLRPWPWSPANPLYPKILTRLASISLRWIFNSLSAAQLNPFFILCQNFFPFSITRLVSGSFLLGRGPITVSGNGVGWPGINDPLGAGYRPSGRGCWPAYGTPDLSSSGWQCAFRFVHPSWGVGVAWYTTHIWVLSGDGTNLEIRSLPDGRVRAMSRGKRSLPTRIITQKWDRMFSPRRDL